MHIWHFENELFKQNIVHRRRVGSWVASVFSHWRISRKRVEDFKAAFFVPPEYSVDNRLKGKIYQTAHLRTLIWDVNAGEREFGVLWRCVSAVHTAVCVCVCVLLLTGICAFCAGNTHPVCVCVCMCVCAHFLGAITTAGRFTGAISRSKFVKWIC